MTTDNDIYKPPDSKLEFPDEQDFELATRGRRLGAALIDGLLIMPITLPLMYFTGGFEGISSGVQPSILYALVMALVGIIVFTAIHGYHLIHYGQTLGKKVLSIKIVDLENRLPDIGCLAKRYGLYWLLPNIPVIGVLLNLGNILLIFSKSKRCLHDRVAGTRVVVVNDSE